MSDDGPVSDVVKRRTGLDRRGEEILGPSKALSELEELEEEPPRKGRGARRAELRARSRRDRKALGRAD